MFSPEALTHVRRARKLSQEELARRSQLATVTIAKLEGGRIPDPRVSTLVKLASALGCTMDSLLLKKAPLSVVAEGKPSYDSGEMETQ